MQGKFEIGQGVHYRFMRYDNDKPNDVYALVIGVLSNGVRVVPVHARRPWTRFYEDAAGSADPCKDNVLLTCGDIFPEVCGGAYNDDCYAIADTRHMAVVPKDACDILADGRKAPEDDVRNVLDHLLGRTQPQRDLYQEDVNAARQGAAAAPSGPGTKRRGGVTEPMAGETPVQDYQPGDTAMQLARKQEADRRLSNARQPAPRDDRPVGQRTRELAETGRQQDGGPDGPDGPGG